MGTARAWGTRVVRSGTSGRDSDEAHVAPFWQSLKVLGKFRSCCGTSWHARCHSGLGHRRPRGVKVMRVIKQFGMERSPWYVVSGLILTTMIGCQRAETAGQLASIGSELLGRGATAFDLSFGDPCVVGFVAPAEPQNSNPPQAAWQAVNTYEQLFEYALPALSRPISMADTITPLQQFLKETPLDDMSVTIVLKAMHSQPGLHLRQPRLIEPNIFASRGLNSARCGDSFVSATYVGKALIATVRIEANSALEAAHIRQFGADPEHLRKILRLRPHQWRTYHSAGPVPEEDVNLDRLQDLASNLSGQPVVLDAELTSYTDVFPLENQKFLSRSPTARQLIERRAKLDLMERTLSIVRARAQELPTRFPIPGLQGSMTLEQYLAYIAEFATKLREAITKAESGCQLSDALACKFPTENEFSFHLPPWDVKKFSPIIVPAWKSTLALGSDARVRNMHVDRQGFLWILGRNLVNVAGQSRYDALLIKMNHAGEVLWKKVWGSEAFDEIVAMQLSPEGEIFVAGNTTGTWDERLSIGFRSIFLAKLSATGDELWRRQFFGKNDLDLADMKMDERGRIVLAATTALAYGEHSGRGFNDAVVIQVDAVGRELWSQQWGTSAHDRVKSLAVVGEEILVLGATAATIPLSGSRSAGGTFLSQLTASGAVTWTEQYGGHHKDIPYAMVASQERILIGGATLGGEFGRTVGNSHDGLLLVLNRDGTRQTFSLFGSRLDDLVTAIAPAPKGQWIIASTTLGDRATGRAGPRTISVARWSEQFQVMQILDIRSDFDLEQAVLGTSPDGEIFVAANGGVGEQKDIIIWKVEL